MKRSVNRHRTSRLTIVATAELAGQRDVARSTGSMWIKMMKKVDEMEPVMM